MNVNNVIVKNFLYQKIVVVEMIFVQCVMIKQNMKILVNIVNIISLKDKILRKRIFIKIIKIIKMIMIIMMIIKFIEDVVREEVGVKVEVEVVEKEEVEVEEEDELYIIYLS